MKTEITWISYEKEKPKDHQRVIVYCFSGEIYDDVYTKKGFEKVMTKAVLYWANYPKLDL